MTQERKRILVTWISNKRQKISEVVLYTFLDVARIVGSRVAKYSASEQIRREQSNQ
jgi:hypothetical protein